MIFLFALTLAVSEPQLPVLCVDATALETSGVAHTDDIVVALRARLGPRKLRVVTCSQLQTEPTWRVVVEPAAANQLALAIRGGFEWRGQVDIQGLRQTQVAEVVALYTVESVRPSVDALLVKLGIESEPPPDTESVDALTTLMNKPVAEPVAEPLVDAKEDSAEIEIQAGPTLAVDPFSVSAYAQVAGKLRLEPVTLAFALGVRSVGNNETLGVTAKGLEVHAALGALKRWQSFELGAFLRGRSTAIWVSGDHANVRHGERTYWDYGLGLSGTAWLKRWESVSLGLNAQGWVWARPQKLTVEGHELLRQSRVDFFVGPVVSMSF